MSKCEDVQDEYNAKEARNNDSKCKLGCDPDADLLSNPLSAFSIICKALEIKRQKILQSQCVRLTVVQMVAFPTLVF